MGAFHGKTGKVTFDAGATSNLIAWTFEATIDVVDVTAMVNTTVLSSTHWKEYVTGYTDWTGSFDILVDDAATIDPNLDGDFAQDADGKAVVFFDGLSGTRKYTGNGIITDITFTTDKNDVAKATYTIQGSGLLVESAVI